MADLVVALDFPGSKPALSLVDRLAERVGRYKVGLELFTRAGPEVVSELRSRGCHVFLDLKLHDIPNTVAGAARAAADLEVDLLTVHALGGARMVEAASAAVEGSSTRIVAVTALTSASSEEWATAMGREGVSMRDETVRLAHLAVSAGAHGVVSSGAEVEAIRARVGPERLLVVPGIRLPSDEVGDQRRVFTPAMAVAAGADLLVVGRPITGSVDPVEAADRFRRAMTMEFTEEFTEA